MLERINDNAYKIELPGHYNVSATFNVADLSPFVAELDDPLTRGRVLPKKGGMMQVGRVWTLTQFLAQQIMGVDLFIDVGLFVMQEAAQVKTQVETN